MAWNSRAQWSVVILLGLDQSCGVQSPQVTWASHRPPSCKQVSWDSILVVPILSMAAASEYLTQEVRGSVLTHFTALWLSLKTVTLMSQRQGDDS